MLFSHKGLGLELYEDGARLVVVTGKPHAPTLEAHQEVLFPPDTLRISLREENVANPVAFVAKIREAYVKLLVDTSRISVSLPDTAGRVVLLDLETRFRTKHEGADIIRWKLKKSLPLETSEMHLDYQVIRERDTGEISVLVSLISRQVIKQYESLLGDAGLQPNRIDFTTFNICRYFQSRLENVENAALFVWHSGIVSILVFQNGALDFYRSKELPGELSDANRLYREINSSFLFYKEKQPGYTLSDAFFVTDPRNAELMRAVIAEATAAEPVFLDAGRIAAGTMGASRDATTLYSLVASMGAAIRNL